MYYFCFEGFDKTFMISFWAFQLHGIILLQPLPFSLTLLKMTYRGSKMSYICHLVMKLVVLKNILFYLFSILWGFISWARSFLAWKIIIFHVRLYTKYRFTMKCVVNLITLRCLMKFCICLCTQWHLWMNSMTIYYHFLSSLHVHPTKISSWFKQFNYPISFNDVYDVKSCSLERWEPKLLMWKIELIFGDNKLTWGYVA